jgi:hypothetical protein
VFELPAKKIIPAQRRIEAWLGINRSKQPVSA